MKSPAVYLVGAGPGDPGLMTVRGLQALQTADVVIHDHLVPALLLDRARADAEVIDVGRGVSQTMAQDAISLLVVEKAREGKLVARLKWGDPFVFDRGGEEALFLREQGVPFEIVPGIPAGIAVPAYAGVPVSYRGGGDTITLVRGYENENRALPSIDWASLVRLEGTVVCYAGAQQLPQILDALRSAGWPGDGSAVIVYNGTMPEQDTLSGTVDELHEQVRDPARRDPAILIVGRVAGFREHLRWFDTKPLFGRRVLVTRPRGQAQELVDRLAALGAAPVESAMIRIAPPDDPAPLRKAAAAAAEFDWIVFSSANAVDAFMEALFHGNADVRDLKGPQLCTTGAATAARLLKYGVRADLVPEEFRAEAVVAALAGHGGMEGASILVPRADIGRDAIASGLRELGARVTEVVAYRTVSTDVHGAEDPDVYRMLLDGRIDIVTFTSPSAVKSFARAFGTEQVVDLLKNTIVAVIGPVTAEAATALGLRVDVQPATYTVPALVEAIAGHVAATPAART